MRCIAQNLNSQRAPHALPLRPSCGVPLVRLEPRKMVFKGFLVYDNYQGSHKNLRKKFHDFSMTFPCPNQNFQTQNTNINCVNIRFCGSYINLLNQLQIYISILIVTPCLLPWIREFIHAQNCNTMLKTTATPFI